MKTFCVNFCEENSVESFEDPVFFLENLLHMLARYLEMDFQGKQSENEILQWLPLGLLLSITQLGNSTQLSLRGLSEAETVSLITKSLEVIGEVFVQGETMSLLLKQWVMQGYLFDRLLLTLRANKGCG